VLVWLILFFSCMNFFLFFFFFSSRRRHTRSKRDWSSDVCSSDLQAQGLHRLVHSFLFVDSPLDQIEYFLSQSYAGTRHNLETPYRSLVSPAKQNGGHR